MNIMHRNTTIGFVALLLTACGGDAPESYVVAEDAARDSAAETAGSAPPASTAEETEAAAGPALTPEYLEGTWCFAYTDLGKGNREEQGIEYVFNTDGTLTYQRNPTSDRMDPGSYEIQGEMIDLRPMFMVFDLRIDTVEDDEFVLKGMGRHNFIRGVCPE